MMNRIYKIIWSKVKHRYVVVSELVRSSRKQSGGQVTKKMATVLAVVALTAGTGGMADAATNGSWTTATDSNGNFTAHIDTENTMGGGAKDNTVVGDGNKVHTANNDIIGDKNELGIDTGSNYVIGDGNTISSLQSSWIIGNDNKLFTNEPLGYWDYRNSLILGSRNTSAEEINSTILIGNDNKVTSYIADSVAIGNGMEFGFNTNESVVIGYMAKNGPSLEEIEKVKTSPGSNYSVVIGSEASNKSPGSIVIGAWSKMGNDSDGSGRGIVIGNGIEIGDKSEESIAIGSGNTKINDEADEGIAIGKDVTIGTESDHAIAIGGVKASVGDDSSHSMAIGSFSKVTDKVSYGAAIGYGASVKSWYAVAIGDYASIEGTSNNSIAIGHETKIDYSAQKTVAIGSESHIGTESDDSIAIGVKSNIGTGSDESIIIGANAALNDESDGSIALGANSNIKGFNNIAIGYTAQVTDDTEDVEQAISLGYKANVNGTYSTAIGSEASIIDNAKETLAIGYKTNANGSYGVALGGESIITGGATYATAVGHSAQSGSEGATVVGAKSTIGKESNYSFIGGYDSSVPDNVFGATVVGSKASAKYDYTTAIGAWSKVEADTDYSVALGSFSEVKKGNLFTRKKLKNFKEKLGDFYNAKWNISAADGYNGVVSVGTPGDKRRIINVAKGRISPNSSDAINGKQIYYLANDLTAQISNAGGVVSAGTNIASVGTGKDETSGKTAYVVNAENASVSVDDNFSLTPTTDNATNITDYNIALKDIVTIGSSAGSNPITINGTTGHITGLTNKTLDVADFAKVGRAATEEQLKAAMGDMKADQQLRDQHLVANPDGGNYIVDNKGEVTLKVKGAPDEDGNATYSDVVIEDVASKKKFDEIVGDGQYFNNETGKGNVVNNDMNVTEAIEALDKAVDKAAVEAGKHRTVSAGNGIKVEKTEATDDKEADYNVSLANDITLTGDDGTNTIHINANDGSITASQSIAVGENTYITTEGINANNQKITNVKAGEADTDAVNVSQLKGVQQQVTNNSLAINKLGNKVDQLDNRVDEVGAGAAALAALHPLDFDPDDKWDFSAGYGNYRGENSVAIGAFYRPNEDTMFSVGGTVGNGNNMVNAGVSIKFGQGNSISTSRVAMAKEIKDLRRELEAMKSAMLDSNAGRKIDTSKLQLFPDVPQNHWAYEYVATLAGNGMIQGYPDGRFDGDRPMTRYEFAAMLYRAMLNGATLSDKILTEFAPELERFTVDTVHTDKDGNPTVERVRAAKRK
ncbi:ESPR-type extended signal peptide-containing protein [Megasphaera sp.]|uniref:ESPR-type extended signal peptide-containing protein n=1 Tax=Megasphaera sp. TaxID=2023260 RepID=UPI0027B9571A|nr:ESPR-type extended signal peptide-containing protein [Megasphaera sp.]